MSKKPVISRKEAAEQSRARLLQAGLELLGTKLGSPFDNIRSTEVASAAGFTPGAFYHHWPSQDDFREDLRAYVGGQTEADESLGRLGDDMIGGSASGMASALKAACRREIAIQVAAPSWHIQLAMLASQAQADLDKSAEQYDIWFASYAEFYTGIFELAGLEMIPGASMDWFVRTMGALNEGFSMQVRSGLSTRVDGLDEDWEAYEFAVATLISSVTRRVDGLAVTAETVVGRLEQLTEPVQA